MKNEILHAKSLTKTIAACHHGEYHHGIPNFLCRKYVANERFAAVDGKYTATFSNKLTYMKSSMKNQKHTSYF